MVLCTATAGNLREVDFLPLTVDVEERMYAAGKIPGSFFKREGRAGEKATLAARLIDRPIRPLFPKGWRYETQLVAIPISVDHVHPYDVLAMNGCSAALMVSHIPLPTPVGAVPLGARAQASPGAARGAATQVGAKRERQAASKAVEEEVLEQYAPAPTTGEATAAEHVERRAAVQLAFDRLEQTLIRERIAVHKK